MSCDPGYAGMRNTAMPSRLQAVKAVRVVPLDNLGVIQVFQEVEPDVMQILRQRVWVEP